MRIADIGEAINYNAHPVRWGINLPRSFIAKNFPLDPNALWDLGRTIGSSPKPEVGIMEAESAVSPVAFEYVKFLYDWSRTSSFAPPIAFGEDEGGGQRSGATLEIRMWPLVKSIRRSRAYLSSGIQRLLHITALILKQKKFEGVSMLAVGKLLDRSLLPQFSEVLPRDHQLVVDEVVKLRSTTPAPTISLETSQEALGRGVVEVSRIRSEMKDKELTPEDPKSNDVIEGTKGKSTPQTGENT